MIKMVIFSGYGSEWKFQFPFGPEQEGRVTQQGIPKVKVRADRRENILFIHRGWLNTPNIPYKL